MCLPLTKIQSITYFSLVTDEECNKEDGKFSCGNDTNICIPENLLCDLEPDCPSSEDELGCREYSMFSYWLGKVKQLLITNEIVRQNLFIYLYR